MSAPQQATALFSELDAIGAAVPVGGSFDPTAASIDWAKTLLEQGN